MRIVVDLLFPHNINMARNTVRSGGQVPEEWAKHMETIRQLYLDEGMTLQEVMRIMASEYGFVASYDQLSTQMHG